MTATIVEKKVILRMTAQPEERDRVYRIAEESDAMKIDAEEMDRTDATEATEPDATDMTETDAMEAT